MPTKRSIAIESKPVRKRPVCTERVVRKPSAITPSEYGEQCVVVDYFENAYPAQAAMLVASANGAHIAGNKLQRAMKVAKLKKAGMKVGFPDLSLFVPRGGYHGLIIEMKRVKGSKTNDPDQIDYIAKLNARGYLAAMCKGADEAIELIKRYMAGDAQREQIGNGI